MRAVSLLPGFILVFCGLAFCEEQGTLNAQAKSNQPFSLLAWNGQQRDRVFIFPHRIDGKTLRMGSPDNLCYTMHSLLVKRDPDSDVTSPAGQRTCTPSSRFKLKPVSPQK